MSGQDEAGTVIVRRQKCCRSPGKKVLLFNCCCELDCEGFCKLHKGFTINLHNDILNNQPLELELKRRIIARIYLPWARNLQTIHTSTINAETQNSLDNRALITGRWNFPQVHIGLWQNNLTTKHKSIGQSVANYVASMDMVLRSDVFKLEGSKNS